MPPKSIVLPKIVLSVFVTLCAGVAFVVLGSLPFSPFTIPIESFVLTLMFTLDPGKSPLYESIKSIVAFSTTYMFAPGCILPSGSFPTSVNVIAVVLAVYLALGENLVNFNLIVFIPIATAAFFVTAHSMVHNDLVDYDLDKINAPHRPLASGKISLINGKIFF